MVPWAHPSRHLDPYISIGSAVFAWLTIVTDRPIDLPRYSSICSNRPHKAHIYVYRPTAMRWTIYAFLSRR